jgi:hypothetical protein
LKRFDNYELARWLTEQELPPPKTRRHRPVVDMIRDWVGRRPRSPEDAADRVPNDWARFVFWLAILAGRVIGLYWGKDQVPGIGRERRWFMRQPFMVPRHSNDFLGFAERLTLGHRKSENTEQLKKLLVHAFLEDLRIAYRRRRFRILPRRPGWRRTAYVTVLLENVRKDNGGWELLRLVNEVRNETGELDPLLVLAASDEQPPPPEEFSTKPAPPQVSTDAWLGWKRKLPGRRQLLADDARYLLISLPAAAGDVSGLPESDRNAWLADGDDHGPGRAPFLAWRGVGEVAVVAVLAAAAIPNAVVVNDYWSVGCSYFSSGTVATKVAEGGRRRQAMRRLQ